MKVFCYFVEPASYSLDLAKNIYSANGVEYCFMNSHTLVKSNVNSNKIFLDRISFLKRLSFFWRIYNKYDLIIVNGYNNMSFFINFLLNIFSFEKKFIAIDSDTQLKIPSFFLKRVIKYIYLSIVFRNKYILGFAGGNKSHKDLFRNYGMNEKRIFLMPMMVDNSKFFRKNKFFPKTFTFLYVGRLVEHKNVENLIKTFNLHFSKKNAILKIVGDGNKAEYLKNRYSFSNVHFLGELFNDDLITEFTNASCFVFPTNFEPWGLVVNEALSSGLPIITTNHVGANYDLITSKKTGFIAYNMNEFGKFMLKFYNDSNLLKAYSNNAINLMNSYWNYKLYNNCFDKVIDYVLKWK